MKKTIDIAAELREKFPDFEPELVEELARAAEVKSFREGDYITTPGQYFQHTMLVLDGIVKVYREDEEDNEFFIYHLHPGHACALSMVCATRQETSAVLAQALTDVTMIAVPIRHMDDFMRRFRSWYYFVLETYRSRFEELLLVIDSIAFHAMDEKLEFYLKRNFKALDTDALDITHQQIANDLSTSREVITRLLKKMVEKGLIRMDRNRIERVKL